MLKTTDPWQFFTPEQLTQAVQAASQTTTKATWEATSAQLDLCGINNFPVQVGVIGTMATETASAFMPVEEDFYLGSAADEYRKKLSYYPYYGRGTNQLTGLNNYKRYSQKLEDLWGIGSPDLVTDMNALLDQDVAAAATALWFRDERALPTPSWPLGYSLLDACNYEDDEWIRRLVYGGRDQAGELRLAKIRALLKNAPSTLLTYNPNQPPERQVQNWVCSIRVATWILKSLGVVTDAGSMQDEMVPGVVTSALGLLDHRGYGIAAAIGKHLPSQTKIEVLETVTWEQLQNRAGRGPIGLGSSDPHLYHWFNIAYAIDAASFSSPNPAPNYPATNPIGDTFTRDEFDRYAGSWSAVFVETVPEVVITPPPVRPRANDLQTLVGVAYHPDGVIIPALRGVIALDPKNVLRDSIQSIINYLEANNPDK